jgi:hypothetical protein
MAAGASTVSGSSYMYSRGTPRMVSHVRTYNWPPLQLNLWILVMLLASASIMGVFGNFIVIQDQLDLPVPWYFPYFITVSGICILFIAGLFYLIATRRLLPAIVMIGAFIMFILWLVGLIIVSIQLWGPNGSVQSSCNLHVFNDEPRGQSMETLAWLQQKSICKAATPRFITTS